MSDSEDGDSIASTASIEVAEDKDTSNEHDSFEYPELFNYPSGSLPKHNPDKLLYLAAFVVSQGSFQMKNRA